MGLYVEGIRRGAEFVQAVRETSMRKPVVVHYIGGNDAGAHARGIPYSLHGNT